MSCACLLQSARVSFKKAIESLGSTKDFNNPFVYVLYFQDGTAYVGSASGTYRLQKYFAIARGTSKAKCGMLLWRALKSHGSSCVVQVQPTASIEEARGIEKDTYLWLTKEGIPLRNSREFGWSGRWVQQDPETQAKRLATIRTNGKNNTHRHSEETKRKMALSKMGDNNPMRKYPELAKRVAAARAITLAKRKQTRAG